MKVDGDYRASGYARVERLVPPEIASALLDRFWADLKRDPAAIAFNASNSDKVLTRKAVELHGSAYPPMDAFLWGLTPAVESIAGAELLPTYCYFRIYQGGDRLRVHSDREACEHSVSLVLGYSDSTVWPFEIGKRDLEAPAEIAEDFGDEPFATLRLEPGDAAVYRGITRRHGRTTPNPNRWSAHLFLHWVEAQGRYRDRAPGGRCCTDVTSAGDLRGGRGAASMIAIALADGSNLHSRPDRRRRRRA